MNEREMKQQVADTGRMLVEKGLVARTWGNISIRRDETSFAISPSGLGYEHMNADDVPVYDYKKDTWEGTRKPSSEKKIHAAAYQIFPDVQCVIHTHQDYATAVGLTGLDNLKMTKEEQELLGEICIAKYGLSSTKMLKKNVEAAFLTGARVVLMVHHGAVILGKDRDEAMKKAECLENVCKRTVEAVLKTCKTPKTPVRVSKKLRAAYPNLVIVTDGQLRYFAERGGFHAQLDDIAQMNGRKLRAVENKSSAILRAFKKQDAILVKGVGGMILTEDEEDAQALRLLLIKAAMTKRYTQCCSVKKELSGIDCALMHFVYQKKYAKKKKG